MHHLTENWVLSKQAAHSARGVVAAQDTRAAAIGAHVLKQGGNAVDAAVATAFALGVVEPWMSGLGGSGYLVVYNAKHRISEVFDFQGVLPGNIHTENYSLDPAVPMSTMGFPGVENHLNTMGYQSISVPGAVKGLCEALDAHGSESLEHVLSPVIDLARAGCEVSWFTTLQIALASRELLADTSASQLFYPHGVPLQPGAILLNKSLVSTLELLADQGPDAMYGGELGVRMVEDLQTGGSCIELEDLVGYQVQRSYSKPYSYRGYDVHTAGPTSGGPRLLDTLRCIESNLDVKQGIGVHSWPVYASALRDAWQIHSRLIGRVTEVGGCTTHLSVGDADGNLVALTYTLLNRFGSGVLLPNTGILMNNAVSYFDPRPGYPTSMAGGARINASNMCPTIAVKENGNAFAVGASGANYIMPCAAVITALMIDYGLSLHEAISHARIDVSEQGVVRADPLLGEAVISALKNEFQVEVSQRLVFPKLYACPSGVSHDRKSGRLAGINDPSQPIGGAVSVEQLCI